MHLPFVSQPSIYASRNDGSIVFAFRDSEPPLVWRYDLSRDPCFTLIARAHEADWEVGFVQSGGGFSRIAAFPERELAEAALYQIARMAGTPVIRWGRLIALAMVLAFSGIVAVSGFSTYFANSKFATVMSSIAGSPAFGGGGTQGYGAMGGAASGFPALPSLSSPSSSSPASVSSSSSSSPPPSPYSAPSSSPYSSLPPQAAGGFPAPSDMSGGASLPQQYELSAGNPMFTPEDSPALKEGIPADADAVLKPPEAAR